VRPTRVVRIQTHAPPELVEGSAAAMSVTQPGIFFTINDSGNEPLLFALDTAGNDRGVWRVRHARNVDWEAASVGPCSRAGRAVEGPPRCVYIGDTGDNPGSASTRSIYRVEEPAARPAGFVGSLIAEQLTYRYPDGPHDVEAMYVWRDGAVYLITKRASMAGARLRPALVYRLPPRAWSSDTVTVADLVDSLPIFPGSAPSRLITDASLSPDARLLAVRTYVEVFVFDTDTATGRVDGSIAPRMCRIDGVRERQGEGITWYGRTHRLLLTSEGLAAPLYVVDCL
jgi:hypothetical protein